MNWYSLKKFIFAIFLSGNETGLAVRHLPGDWAADAKVLQEKGICIQLLKKWKFICVK